MDGESEAARESRILSLWKKLDTNDQGTLDVEGLKKGLKKIDHRTHPLKRRRLGKPRASWLTFS